MPKIAEIKLSNCGEKNCDCGIAVAECLALVVSSIEIEEETSSLSLYPDFYITFFEEKVALLMRLLHELLG